MINKFPQTKPKVLIGNNQLVITVNPFDNFYRFTLSRLENDAVIRYNLNDYTEIKMTIKGPKKDLNFNVFRESNENDFENGVLVFRISESMNAELGRLAKKNFNLFYINGIDVFGNRQIIYSGFYKMWDSKLNIEKLEQEYGQENSAASNVVTQDQANSGEQEEVNNSINNGTNINTTTNSSDTSISEQITNSTIDISSFKPRYRASDLAISIGLAPPVNDKLDYKELTPAEKGQLLLNFERDNFWTQGPELSLQGLVNLYPGPNGSLFDKNLYIDYIEAYFKGLDILPNNTVYDNWFRSSILKNDLIQYIKTKPFRTSSVIAGLYLPVIEEHKLYFRSTNIPQFTNNRPPESRNLNNVQQAANAQQAPNTLQSSNLQNSSGNNSPALLLKGIVRDSANNDRGISGAAVYLSTSLSYNNSQVTDSNGKFNFGDIIYIGNAQSIRFEVKAEGYTDLIEDFTLNDLKRNGGELKTSAGDIRPDGLRLEPTPKNTTNTQGTSDESKRIKIRVENDLGETLSGAQVTLSMDQRPGSEKTILTDANGSIDIDREDFTPEIKIFVAKNGHSPFSGYISTEQELDTVIVIKLLSTS